VCEKESAEAGERKSASFRFLLFLARSGNDDETVEASLDDGRMLKRY
jgi:hypothetical protein